MPVCDPTGPAAYSRAATCILLHCYFPVWMPALNQPVLHHCVSGFRNSVRAKEALVEASNRVSDKTPRRSRNIISKERSDWLALRLPTILYCIFVYRKNNRTTNGLWIPQDRQSLSYSTINCSELWRLAMQWDGLYRKRCMYMSSTHAILPRQPRSHQRSTFYDTAAFLSQRLCPSSQACQKEKQACRSKPATVLVATDWTSI
jgi:hypothetical protein